MALVTPIREVKLDQRYLQLISDNVKQIARCIAMSRTSMKFKEYDRPIGIVHRNDNTRKVSTNAFGRRKKLTDPRSFGGSWVESELLEP